MMQMLAKKKVFSKIDLRSAYWQFLTDTASIENSLHPRTRIWPIWEFTVMLYRLTGAT